MFKYNLDQIVFYMMDNCICSAPVMSRMCVENMHNDWDSTAEQKNVFLPFGISGIFYGTCHGILSENEAFESKAALAEFLSREV